jgi:NRAMP (natural resistance-associated macrophage protein)-like metal ion transporter
MLRQQAYLMHMTLYETLSANVCPPNFLFIRSTLDLRILGIAAAFLFALALLAAGQSSSIIATVAGQAVAEGFLQWKISVSTPRFRPE